MGHFDCTTRGMASTHEQQAEIYVAACVVLARQAETEFIFLRRSNIRTLGSQRISSEGSQKAGVDETSNIIPARALGIPANAVDHPCMLRMDATYGEHKLSAAAQHCHGTIVYRQVNE